VPVNRPVCVIPTNACRIESDASGFEYMAAGSSDESARWQSGVHGAECPAIGGHGDPACEDRVGDPPQGVRPGFAGAGGADAAGRVGPAAIVEIRCGSTPSAVAAVSCRTGPLPRSHHREPALVPGPRALGRKPPAGHPAVAGTRRCLVRRSRSRSRWRA
jgi:hypothetical protein